MAGKCPLSLLILPSCPGRFVGGGGGLGGDTKQSLYGEARP